jgi:AraC-like DNA-binding protein
MQRRIERAKVLMRRTRQPLALIAQEVGFADQSHLTAIFRRERGSHPDGFALLWPETDGLSEARRDNNVAKISYSSATIFNSDARRVSNFVSMVRGPSHQLGG